MRLLLKPLLVKAHARELRVFARPFSTTEVPSSDSDVKGGRKTIKPRGNREIIKSRREINEMVHFSESFTFF